MRDSCRVHAGQVAVRAEDGERTFTEVWEAALAVAADLREHGAGPGDRVGLWAVKTADLLAGMVGILASGAAYVPFDVTYPAERLAFIVEDAKPICVVSATAYVADAARLGVPVISLRRRSHPPIDAHEPHGTDAAYVIYTSGSTGHPKGVVVEHASVVNLLRGMASDLQLRPGDALVGTAPIAFDASVPNLLLPLVTGATLCLPSAESARDPSVIAALVDAPDVRVLKCSNSVLRMLCEIDWPGRPDLKVVTGGEALPTAVVRTLLPRVAELWNYYGPTETTVSSMRIRLSEDDLDPVPIGWVMPGVAYRIIGPDLEVVAPGEVGELWISGPGVARGYLADPERTAARFIELPDDRGGTVRGYRTGDLARERPDGALLMLGRADDQRKLGGFRIELAEIEHRLAEHPDVLQAVAAVHRNGRGDDRLVAFVRSRSDALRTDDLRAFAGRLLPTYMVPSVIEVVDRFPLTTGGKVDRRALAERPVKPPLTGSGGTAETPLQRQVAGLFATVLDLPADMVGVDDDFFALGGRSIRAVELMALVARDLGPTLPLSILMTASTVGALAEAVEEHRRGTRLQPLVVLRKGEGPPLFLVHDVNGEFLPFREVVAALPASQPIFGLQLRGVDRTVPVPHDLRALIDEYVEEVLGACPDGPFLFAGFSFGGVIAYLMAVRLAEMGRPGATVALIDVNPPRQLLRAAPPPSVAPSAGTPSKGAKARLEHLRIRVRDASDLIRDRSWRLVAGPLWIERDRVLPSSLHSPARVLKYALARFGPIPVYDGRVSQVWGDHPDHVTVERMKAGWNSVVANKIDLTVITGEDVTHAGFLKNRCGRLVAASLAQEIGAVLAASDEEGDDDVIDLTPEAGPPQPLTSTSGLGISSTVPSVK